LLKGILDFIANKKKDVEIVNEVIKSKEVVKTNLYNKLNAINVERMRIKK